MIMNLGLVHLTIICMVVSSIGILVLCTVDAVHAVPTNVALKFACAGKTIIQ